VVWKIQTAGSTEPKTTEPKTTEPETDRIDKMTKAGKRRQR
jgi:hypothetical protein